jgi:hypothetical protein
MSKSEQVFEKFAQRGREMGRGRGNGRGMGRGGGGGRFFAKSEVERVMSHYKINEAEAYKLITEGKAKLPPVGTLRGKP